MKGNLQKFKGKKAKIILIVAAICIAAAVLILILRKAGGQKEDGPVVYSQTVSEWMGNYGASGMNNRYAGVVESQDTWSVNLEQDATVAEVYVSEGDEVKKGDSLFRYDSDKYQTDLEQADIDLTRMNNELKSIQDAIDTLTKQMNKASGTDKTNLSLQVEEQKLSLQQKQLDIESKQNDIDKLNDRIKNAVVKSQIDGVVKKINNSNNSGSQIYMGDSTDDSNAFITIMQTGDLRVKGTVNEQNVSALTEGSPVIVHSRADKDKTWHGTISKIDTDKTAQNSQSGVIYSGNEDSSVSSSKYNFYVELDDSSDMMMGQHVYIELDMGQEEENGSSDTEAKGISLYEFLIDETDPDHPFVWADNGKGKLVKKEVQLGDKNEETGTVQVLSGISEEDAIVQPDGTQTEGMTVKPMSEMTLDYESTEDSGSTDDAGMTEETTTEDAGDVQVIGGADQSAG
ncbi:MAG: efflux RND transporter periplasmic adaptor subunit [Eubacterium sp.]|nr:efflux RND transporter periplasmic adaptor subunit [Eubacterium sp.]